MRDKGPIDSHRHSVDDTGRPLTPVLHRSQQDALRFLSNILVDQRGVGLLHGPEYSGKSAVIDHVVKDHSRRTTVAIVDGTDLKPSELLSTILKQFGYPVQLNTDDELLNMLCVITVQQTRSNESPIVVVRNINAMNPDTLNVLCALAGQKIQDRYAVRLVLVTDQPYCRIIDSPSMSPIADRLAGRFALTPMSARESLAYIYARLEALEFTRPDSIFAVDVCSAMHDAADGWPGQLDDIILTALDQAKHYPIRLEDIKHSAFGNAAPQPVIQSVKEVSRQKPDTPRLVVSSNGETIEEIDLIKSRALIGRSTLSDVVISSNLVSRQHALLICDQGTVVIVDLKSSNGTFVNSRRVSSKVLLDNDIIVIGDHRIKLIFEGALHNVELEECDSVDTAEMRAIRGASQVTLADFADFEGIDKKA